MTVQRVDPDGTCRVWYSLPHAAQAIGRTPATVRKWIANGDLTVRRHDLVPGVVLIEQVDLWEAERAVTARAGASTRYVRKSSTQSCRSHGDDLSCVPGSAQCIPPAPAETRLSA